VPRVASLLTGFTLANARKTHSQEYSVEIAGPPAEHIEHDSLGSERVPEELNLVSACKRAENIEFNLKTQ
jgi:hypothetical protein